MNEIIFAYKRYDGVTGMLSSSAFKDIFVSIVIRLLTVSPVLSQRFSHR